MIRNKEKLIDAARDVLKTAGYFVDHLWHVDDVHFICEQHQLTPIKDEEAMQVFAIANQQFDGETGISWPQLEKAFILYQHRQQVLREDLV